MKRLCFYLTRFPEFGGIGSVTTIITNELSKRRYHIIILSHLKQNKDTGLIKDIPIYYLPDTDKWNTPKNYERAKEILESERINTLIYQDSYAPTERIACNLAKELRLQLFVFEHNSPLYIYNKRDLDSIFTLKGLARRILHLYLLTKERKRKRYLLNNCTKYVLLAKRNINEFCNLIGITDSPKLTYINNPILLSPNEFNVNKENIILFVGRINKTKGVDLMISVWKKLYKNIPDWKFYVVGDGENKLQLEHQVKSKQIPNILFLGFKNPTPYYAKAKIFWMMSKFEGWPMTLLESMQQGCVPIVYESFSAVNDIIDDGINGYLVPDKDIKSFISQTKSLIDNTNKWQSMSENARQKVKQFDVQKIADDWVNLLS